MPNNPKDISGQRFGSWTASTISHRVGKYIFWYTVCDCGTKGTVRGDSLRSGGSVRCLACQAAKSSVDRRRHGMKKTGVYQSWISMRRRCLNPNASDYPSYGGRGIGICERWEIFENFAADMGERPAGASLDRIAVDGNYEPGNCRWATALEQGRNRRRTVYLEANGRRQALSAWAVELGIAHITLLKRREAGWTDEQIVNTPLLPPTCSKPRGHLNPRRRSDA